MEKKLNEKESLELINEMISQARFNLHEKSGLSTIIAGCAVAFVALLNFVLLYSLPNLYLSFHVWWLMIPLSMINGFIGRRIDRGLIVKTHIDRIVGSVWRGFGYSIIVFLIAIFGLVFITKLWVLTIVITPVILILVGLAQYATATACRFKPYFYGSFIFWGGALLCLVSYLLEQGNFQFIILALCMILGFVIPGFIANKRAKEHV